MKQLKLHRAKIILILAAAMALVSIIRPSPVFAHEIPVIVLAPSGSSDARDGFKLAVDESPDITHPSGVESGDHLGGIDVDITYLEDSQITKLNSALLNGTSVLAVISTPDTVEAVRNTSNIDRAFVVSAGVPIPTRPGWIVLVDTPGEASRLADFRSRYQSSYGRAPTIDSYRGYDAAKVLDLAIAASGESISGTAAGTFAPDNSRLLASTTGTAPPTESPTPSTPNNQNPQTSPQSSSSEPGLTSWQKALLALLAGAAVCTLVFIGLRRVRK